MEYIIILICIIIGVSIFIYFEAQNNNMIYVKSSINHKKYLVRNVPDKQEASNLLGDMCIRITKLLNYLEYGFSYDKSNLKDLKLEEKIEKLINYFTFSFSYVE